MNVLIDEQIFCLQTHGGISRYFVELMRQFTSDQRLGIDLTRSTVWTKNRHLMEAGFARPLPIPFGNRGRVLKFANGPGRHSAPVDVVHHTYYDSRYIRDYQRCRLRAITVHDMIPELFPDYFPGGNPHIEKRAYVDSANLVFCVSQSTRRDLLNVYGPLDVPIVVTPLGVSEVFRPNLPRPSGLPARYLLFVGARGRYKDFSVLVEAFAHSGIAREFALLAVGGGPVKAEERRLLDHFGLTGRVKFRTPSDRDLAPIYSNAECFVFPSRYEGFGLPTLEAMASGCATILADSSSHLETGGDAALFFSAGNAADLADVLSTLMQDEALRSDHIRRGLAHAAQFTWRDTARQTAAAYREHL